MKEKWLFHGAVVPVDVETTAALVAEIKRLINVIGGMALAQPAQEPVAWMSTLDVGFIKSEFGDTPTVPLYTTLPQRPWVELMRGVRVEGDTVIISVKGGNDAARELCGALIKEMES